MIFSPMSGLAVVLCMVGPYLMLYAWTVKFWIRMFAGFTAFSLGVAQFASSSASGHVSVDPADGADSQIALIVTCGIIGALFSGFSKTVGLFCLSVWGATCLFTFIVVLHERYRVSAHLALDKAPVTIFYLAVLAVPSVIITVLHSWRPGRFATVMGLMAALFGAASGSHSMVQGIYSSWGSPPSERCGLHPQCVLDNRPLNASCCPDPGGTTLACCGTEHWNGLNLANRGIWCSEEDQCKQITKTFFAFMAISLIGQLFLCGTEMELPKSEFTTASDRGAPTAAPDPHWRVNLRTPRLTKFFLLCVLLVSCVFVFPTAMAIDWTRSSFIMALLYVFVQTFTLWSVVEFSLLTVFFHVIRLIFDMPKLPRKILREGLPSEGRTMLAYCLLSSQANSSKESFRVACEAHLANLDPNGRITTSVVSVSSVLSVVQAEMACRDACRVRIREVLLQELEVVLEEQEASKLRGEQPPEESMHALATALHRAAEGSYVRARFWYVLVQRVLASGTSNLREALQEKVESECVAHFIYLHRNCRILKKPGQYQDLMVLGSTGNNSAYTYLAQDYGALGREPGSPCFGFEGNVLDRDEEGVVRSDDLSFAEIVEELSRRGAEDIELVVRLGHDPSQRYHYTMVLDSDTVCPARSIRSLIEVAEHPDNARHGIVNASLLHDFRRSERCTWHMWRSALVEVSKVNLLRGQYAIYDRVGFYGKGLMRNDMYINRVIGTPGFLCEALPIEILSHDTVEAKLMHPCVAYEVVLFEDTARNPISALSQSTRWLLGEVRNACYLDGPYRFLIRTGENCYAKVRTGRSKKFAWTRWTDVPCGLGAEYLSHIGFRGFHAGPMIMALNLMGVVSYTTSLLRGRDGAFERGDNITVLFFVIVVLYVMPNAFMLLGYIPSLRLGRLQAGKAAAGFRGDLEQPLAAEPPRFGPEADGAGGEDDAQGLCAKKLVLVLLEIVLSVILYAPEQIEGILRLSRGAWSQITGTSSWVPQARVEEEVEERLSLRYALGKTWQVSAVGLLTWAFMILFGAWNPFWIVIAAVWTLHPFITYWLCMPFPESLKTSWIWTWTMDLRERQNRRLEF